jgi:hypothetical protein
MFGLSDFRLVASTFPIADFFCAQIELRYFCLMIMSWFGLSQTYDCLELGSRYYFVINLSHFASIIYYFVIIPKVKLCRYIGEGIQT